MNMCKSFACARNKKKSNNKVTVAAKTIKAKFIACELSVKRVVTFGMVLYCSQ